MKKYDPWSDKECIKAFCEKNADDFDYFVAEYFPSDYRTSNHENFELAYCDKYEDGFIEFAYNFEQDVDDYYADQINSLRGEE